MGHHCCTLKPIEHHSLQNWKLILFRCDKYTALFVSPKCWHETNVCPSVIFKYETRLLLAILIMVQISCFWYFTTCTIVDLAILPSFSDHNRIIGIPTLIGIEVIKPKVLDLGRGIPSWPDYIYNYFLNYPSIYIIIWLFRLFN